MYQVGDKVVYPMHGAGVIDAIEEKRILGKDQKYYILKLPINSIKLMIPMDNIVEIGLRDPVALETAEQVLETFKCCGEDINTNWNKRYRENMDKMKSGELTELASVVKTLMLRDKTKGLSTAEKKMLTTAKNIFISELVLTKETSVEEIEEILYSCI